MRQSRPDFPLDGLKRVSRHAKVLRRIGRADKALVGRLEQELGECQSEVADNVFSGGRRPTPFIWRGSPRRPVVPLPVEGLLRDDFGLPQPIPNHRRADLEPIPNPLDHGLCGLLARDDASDVRVVEHCSGWDKQGIREVVTECLDARGFCGAWNTDAALAHDDVPEFMR